MPPPPLCPFRDLGCSAKFLFAVRFEMMLQSSSAAAAAAEQVVLAPGGAAAVGQDSDDDVSSSLAYSQTVRSRAVHRVRTPPADVLALVLLVWANPSRGQHGVVRGCSASI